MNSDNYNDNFTWWNSTATTSDNITFAGTFNLTTTATNTNYYTNTIKTPPDKNWMPYAYVEYEPVWHKKFARYKLQMEKMWLIRTSSNN